MAQRIDPKKLDDAVGRAFDYDQLEKPVHLLGERRWPLIPTCVWIVTRNEVATARTWRDDKSGAEWELNTMRAFGGLPAHDRLDDGWRQIAEEMTEGNISAIATRVSTEGVIAGVSHTVPGVQFPPSDQMGAGLGYELRDLNEEPGIAPIGSAGAYSVVEFREITLPRAKIMQLWPSVGSVVSATDNAEGAVASSAPVVESVPGAGDADDRKEIEIGEPHLPGAKRGRPPYSNWDLLEAETVRLMNYNGEFESSKEDWNAIERLKEALLRYCQANDLGEPGRTQLDARIREWLIGWRGSRK